jgi:hypothetical protein
MAEFPVIEESVDMSRGTPVICVKYRGLLQVPMPHLSPPTVPFVPGQHVIVLEFDGSIPHLPLIGAEITPEPAW